MSLLRSLSNSLTPGRKSTGSRLSGLLPKLTGLRQTVISILNVVYYAVYSKLIIKNNYKETVTRSLNP